MNLILAQAIITSPDPVPFDIFGLHIRTHAQLIVLVLALVTAAVILLYFACSWLFGTSKAK